MTGTSKASSGAPASACRETCVNSSKLILATQVILLIALWFATRPYRGVIHDSILYTAQAILHNNPEYLQNDLAFYFGGQEKFSIFPGFFGFIINKYGISIGNIFVSYAAQTAFFLSIIVFFGSLFRFRHEAILASAAVILLDPHYGAARLLSYGEAFATARPWAEALVLAGIAVGLPRDAGVGRIIVCVGMLIVAATLHPLQVLPGVGVIGVFWALRYPRLLWLAGLALAGGLAVGYAGVEPFSRLYTTYDPHWLAIIRVRLGYAFIGTWSFLDWVWPFIQAAILVAVWRVASRLERQLLLSVLIVAAFGLLAAGIGGDFGANVLLVGLQTWRALWLLAVLANAFLVILLLRLPPVSLARKVLLIAFACSVFERFGEFTGFFSPILFLLALLLLWREWYYQKEVSAVIYLIVWTIAFCVCVLVVMGLGFALMASPRILFAWEMWIGCAVAVVAFAWLSFWTGPNPHQWRTLLLAGLVLAVAFWTVDRRSPWNRFVEDDNQIAELTAFIGTNSTPYWERGLELLWLKLRRPAGFGCYQGAGGAFSRGMAIEFERRYRALSVLNTADFELKPDAICPPRRDPSRRGAPSVQEIAEACRALPELKIIILSSRVPGLATTTWDAPIPMRLPGLPGEPLREVRRFYRYECSRLR